MVHLPMSLKMSAKPKAAAFYDKVSKLTDPDSKSSAGVSGEIRLRVIAF